MPELYLMRHAQAQWGDARIADIDRPLDAAGRREATAMGRFLDGQPLVDALWVSPARRVEQTVERLCRTCARLPEPRIVDALYGADADTLIALARQAGGERLMLVGHNPGMHDAAVRLSQGMDSEARGKVRGMFPTAALAILSFPKGWSALADGAATMTGFTCPADL